MYVALMVGSIVVGGALIASRSTLAWGPRGERDTATLHLVPAAELKRAAA